MVGRWARALAQKTRMSSHIRCHHHLKTFCTGFGGWADRQLSDGTVIWTAPTGHTYTTTPGGAVFFPILADPTGELVLPTALKSSGENRGLMMPTRKRTRADERAARIAAERRINEERLAEERRKRAAWLTVNYEPPPF